MNTDGTYAAIQLTPGTPVPPKGGTESLVPSKTGRTWALTQEEFLKVRANIEECYQDYLDLYMLTGHLSAEALQIYLHTWDPNRRSAIERLHLPKAANE
jgi:hypothetical protein